MPEGAKETVEATVREQDIYRYYAVTLLSVNEFVYDHNSEKFSMNSAQAQLSILGGVANRYLLSRVDDPNGKDAEEIKKTIEKQKVFCNVKVAKGIDFAAYKKIAAELIDEYDNLVLKYKICR